MINTFSHRNIKCLELREMELVGLDGGHQGGEKKKSSVGLTGQGELSGWVSK